MTREIQSNIKHVLRISSDLAQREGVPEDRGLITAQVIAQRIFPEEGIDYLTHPLARRVNRLVDIAIREERRIANELITAGDS